MYEKIDRRFWENVEAVLSERSMSWNELAEMIGLTAGAVFTSRSMGSNVILGRAKEIAEALGTSMDRLPYGDPRYLERLAEG